MTEAGLAPHREIASIELPVDSRLQFDELENLLFSDDVDVAEDRFGYIEGLWGEVETDPVPDTIIETPSRLRGWTTKIGNFIGRSNIDTTTVQNTSSEGVRTGESWIENAISVDSVTLEVDGEMKDFERTIVHMELDGLRDSNTFERNKEWQDRLDNNFIFEGDECWNDPLFWIDYVRYQMKELEEVPESSYNLGQKWTNIIQIQVYKKIKDPRTGEEYYSQQPVRQSVLSTMPKFDDVERVTAKGKEKITFHNYLQKEIIARNNLQNRRSEWRILKRKADLKALNAIPQEGFYLENEHIMDLFSMVGREGDGHVMGDAITNGLRVWNLISELETPVINLKSASGKEFQFRHTLGYQFDSDYWADAESQIAAYIVEETGISEEEAIEAVSKSRTLAEIWGVFDWGDAKAPNGWKIRAEGLDSQEGEGNEIFTGEGVMGSIFSRVMHPWAWMETQYRKAGMDDDMSTRPSKVFAAGYTYYADKYKDLGCIPVTWMLPLFKIASVSGLTLPDGTKINERLPFEDFLMPRTLGGKQLPARMLPWHRSQRMLGEQHWDAFVEKGMAWSATMASYFEVNPEEHINFDTPNKMNDTMYLLMKPELLAYIEAQGDESLWREYLQNEQRFKRHSKKWKHFVDRTLRHHADALSGLSRLEVIAGKKFGQREFSAYIQGLAQVIPLSFLEKMRKIGYPKIVRLARDYGPVN